LRARRSAKIYFKLSVNPINQKPMKISCAPCPSRRVRNTPRRSA
jgi:hypothetical protein